MYLNYKYISKDTVCTTLCIYIHVWLQKVNPVCRVDDMTVRWSHVLII